MATTYSDRNLAATVEGHRGAEKQAARRRRCSVGHAIDPWGNGGRTWTHDHRWVAKRSTDGTYSKPAERCLNCGKTLREILILIKPEPLIGSRAHLERALASGL